MHLHISYIIGLDIAVASATIHYLCVSVKYIYKERITAILGAFNRTSSAQERLTGEKSLAFENLYSAFAEHYTSFSSRFRYSNSLNLLNVVVFKVGVRKAAF